ncbi:MAG TPA: DUF4349 domain-containing protein [Streptosporangiaceae bacterium]
MQNSVIEHGAIQHGARQHAAAPRLTRPAAAGLIIITGLVLGGCSASGASGSGAGSAASAGHGFAGRSIGAPAPAPADLGKADQGPAGTAAGGRPDAGTAARLAPAGQDIVYTASMTVRVASVSRAATRATQIAGRAGGYVSSENAALPPGRRGYGTVSIQLKIPVAGYPAVLSELAGGLGTETYLRQQAQEVTQQVTDTASLVASDQAGIAQLRALLRRAGSVAELLSVQDQINAQESSLEALQAQQRTLDHQTAYATVTLTLAGPAPAAAPPRHHAGGGFTGGLTAGWRALRTVISWLLQAAGAVLPIGAALALALLLGYRGVRMLRRRARPGGA